MTPVAIGEAPLRVGRRFFPDARRAADPNRRPETAVRRSFANATKRNSRIATRCAIRPLVSAARVTDS
jgi:hypothetical protein